MLFSCQVFQDMTFCQFDVLIFFYLGFKYESFFFKAERVDIDYYIQNI